MKYVLLIIFVLAVSILIPIITFFIIEKVRNKKFKRWIKGIIIPFSSLAIASIIVLTYLSIHYSAEKVVDDYLKSDNEVEVIKKNDYYLFDNKINTDKAIIFYGGAKVEEKSYAPLLNKIAHYNIDVFLMKMPFHIAILKQNSADIVMKNYSYSSPYLMGHSLGGAVASLYLNKTDYNFKGIIFLASYSTKKIDDSLSSLSIYGSNDGVLNKKEYAKNKYA